jgi:hypothetical protein
VINLHPSIRKIFYFLSLFTGVSTYSLSQGRVVINEYLPWPANGCGVTSEYVELLNFGPGPINIGCYILTDGDFSITIPANTILQAGDYFVISGQNTISSGCANIDSAITVDLNWTTCNCTSGTIPTTGDGFMTDGGSASEQIVLLDPNKNVVDAVVRTLPAESSSNITTSTAGGNCTSRTFDLDLMGINYETIGESAGRGNSIARKIDGDCAWVKDTKQSGNANNNTNNETSSVSYSLTYTEARACPVGSVVVSVFASNYSSIFPMSYILAYDADSNGVFNFSDQYTTGSDSSASTIPVSNLAAGDYRITLASSNGCFLNTINFTILGCFELLSIKILSFEAKQLNNKIECRWSIDNTEYFARTEIERSSDGSYFEKAATVTLQDATSGKKDFRYLLNNDLPGNNYLRLVVYDKNEQKHLSPVININSKPKSLFRLRTNPVNNELKIDVSSDKSTVANYLILDNENRRLAKGRLQVKEGINIETIQASNLPKGFYRLLINTPNSDSPATIIGFIKL